MNPAHSWFSCSRIIPQLAFAIAVFGSSSCCSADVFRFRDGRVLSGRLVGSPSEKLVDGVPTTFWTVEVAEGEFVQISERELTHLGHEAPSETEIEYAQRIQATPPQTAEDHCAIAGWCAQNALKDLQRAHYLQALDLDPNNAVARAGAGFMKDNNGRWASKEEIMGEQRGKILVGSRWRFPEDLVIEQAREKDEQELAPIRKKMHTLHSAIAFGRSEKMRTDSIGKLRQIQDPREASILGEYLVEKRRKAPVNAKLLYINVLSRFPVAIPALTNASLNDENPNVRAAARDALRALDAQSSIPTFLGYLQNPDNVLVNRAAKGLALFKPKEAILPLIEALVTVHEEEKGGGNTTYSVQGGMTLGGKKEKVQVPKQNPAVLEALTQTAAQVGLQPGGFDYNENLWFAWYASIYAAPVQDLRRDP